VSGPIGKHSELESIGERIALAETERSKTAG